MLAGRETAAHRHQYLIGASIRAFDIAIASCVALDHWDRTDCRRCCCAPGKMEAESLPLFIRRVFWIESLILAIKIRWATSTNR
jgi:hypothetical protein